MTTNRVWVANCILTFLALTLVLIQHWGTTFTNADDPWIAQMSYGSGVVESSINMAKNQGRFWQVPIMIIAQWPYLFDSWKFVNAIKIIFNGLTFLCFVLFCSKLINKHTGLVIGLVWLALIDINSSNYSPFHGYVLMFNLPFCFLFLSFYLFLNRLELKGDSAQAIVTPYLFFAIALLAYEPMFFYCLVFPALYLYKQTQSNTALKFSLFINAKKFLTQNFALVAISMIYVFCYFGFRKFSGKNGGGLVSWSNLHEVMKTIFDFSVHGFYVQFKPFIGDAWESFTTTGLLLSALFAGLITFGMFLILPRTEENLTLSYFYRKKSLVILGFFIFSPNLLFGLTEGYRKWASHDPHYIGNYFSSFPLAMAIAFLVLSLVGGAKSKYENALFFFILYVIFCSAFGNYLRWSQLEETNRDESVLWQKAIRYLSQQPYDHNRQTLICATNAPEHVSADDKYWSQYLSKIFASNIRYLSNTVSPTSCNVMLNFKKF